MREASVMLEILYLSPDGDFMGVCIYKNSLSYNHISVLHVSHK